VVQITFSPAVVSYQDILNVFFAIHDPTTLNRQAADVGSQYRSVIFFHTPAQRETAERIIQELNMAQIWNHPIVTEVAPVPEYYPAEAYHQNYFRSNPYQGYCQAVVAPKVAKFRKTFTAFLPQ
jgi:peptide-methionine (S)-S-oxide reductase